jgi:hypothetical protein
LVDIAGPWARVTPPCASPAPAGAEDWADESPVPHDTADDESGEVSDDGFAGAEELLGTSELISPADDDDGDARVELLACSFAPAPEHADTTNAMTPSATAPVRALRTISGLSIGSTARADDRQSGGGARARAVRTTTRQWGWLRTSELIGRAGQPRMSYFVS